MTNSVLTVTKSLNPTDGSWNVTATITPGGGIPQAIFVYTNTGIANQLGTYFGVCSVSDLARLQIYNGVTVFPPFGNKFLRYTTATINIPISTDPLMNVDTIIGNLKSAVQSFSTAYQAQALNTTVYTIT